MQNTANYDTDLRIHRAWDETATAAASDSTAVATKAAAAGSTWVVTEIDAGYDGSVNVTGNLVISVGGTTVRTYAVVGTRHLGPRDIEWINCGINASVAATLSASGVSGSLGYVNVGGFYVGKR